MMRKYKRGEVYFCNLDSEPYGHEQGGLRPVVIIQNNVGNYYGPTLIVACLTKSLNKHSLPTHITIPNEVFVEDKEHLRYNQSLIMLEQIKTVDKKRMKTYIGKIPKEYMKEIDEAIMLSLGIN